MKTISVRQNDLNTSARDRWRTVAKRDDTALYILNYKRKRGIHNETSLYRKNKNNVTEICRVIDSDIVTGNALVFNRESKEFEEITIAERKRLNPNIRKLAEDTPQYDYRLANLVRIENNLYTIKIKVDEKYYTRRVSERVYNALVAEVRNRY